MPTSLVFGLTQQGDFLNREVIPKSSPVSDGGYLFAPTNIIYTDSVFGISRDKYVASAYIINPVFFG